MFSASIATGDVLAVDVLTGESHLVVDALPERILTKLGPCQPQPDRRGWRSGNE